MKTNETQEIDADALRARLAEMAQRARDEMAPAAAEDPRAEVERLRERLSALHSVTRASLEAASSGRRVTACEDIERLQRERDAALAVVAGLREEISDTADTLHRLSLAQQRLASQGSEDARARGEAYLRAAQIVATIGDPARAAEVSK